MTDGRNDKSAGQPICTAEAARRVAPRDGRNDYWWVQLRPQGLYYARRGDGEDVPLQEGECPDWESLPAPPGARILLCVPGAWVRTHAVNIPTRNPKRFFTALLRFPQAAGGAALDEDAGAQPSGGLQLALERSNRPPARLEVRVRNREQYEQVGNWESWLAERDVELARLQVDMSRPACLARQAAPPEQVNMLTGKYDMGRDRLLQSRRFVPAAGLAAALVLALAAQWFVEDSRIRTEHERLTRAIEDTYREAFPGARNLVNPRHQMEQRLLAAAGADGGGQERQIDILDWLERLAPFLDKEADARLDAFSFDGRQMTLDLSLPDFEALEALQEQLAGSLLLRVETTELREGRVHSRIHLEKQT